jgi:acyl dehydratase
MKKLIIGDTFKMIRSFSKEEVIVFANLSGDLNPLHTDEEFAKSTIFKKPICHGTSSLKSRPPNIIAFFQPAWE